MCGFYKKMELLRRCAWATKNVRSGRFWPCFWLLFCRHKKVTMKKVFSCLTDSRDHMVFQMLSHDRKRKATCSLIMAPYNYLRGIKDIAFPLKGGTGMSVRYIAPTKKKARLNSRAFSICGCFFLLETFQLTKEEITFNSSIFITVRTVNRVFAD